MTESLGCDGSCSVRAGDVAAAEPVRLSDQRCFRDSERPLRSGNSSAGASRQLDSEDVQVSKSRTVVLKPDAFAGCKGRRFVPHARLTR